MHYFWGVCVSWPVTSQKRWGFMVPRKLSVYRNDNKQIKNGGSAGGEVSSGCFSDLYESERAHWLCVELDTGSRLLRKQLWAQRLISINAAKALLSLQKKNRKERNGPCWRMALEFRWNKTSETLKNKSQNNWSVIDVIRWDAAFHLYCLFVCYYLGWGYNQNQTSLYLWPNTQLNKLENFIPL